MSTRRAGEVDMGRDDDLTHGASRVGDLSGDGSARRAGAGRATGAGVGDPHAERGGRARYERGDRAPMEEAESDGRVGGEQRPGIPPDGPRPGSRLRDLRLAVFERLPLWLQERCAVRPRALVAVVVVLLIAVAMAVHHFRTGRPETVSAPAEQPPAKPMSGKQQPGADTRTTATPRAGADRTVVVDVAGKVRAPGVRRLPAGSRVADAIKAAGGAKPGARLGELNRARVLVDGEQIAVGVRPGAGSAPASGASSVGGNGVPNTGASGLSTGSGVGAATGGTAGVPVSLSTATAEQLDGLPGVGPVLARHILDYRDQHGGFDSVEELREVTGIGDKRFADLRPLVQP
ncbi:helix-hairpin-helix domain-containing protein [Streptomyces buecherae]|uniref:helix-hairpin-helix domain-containing protein n=1 Tax=Streptomyces buecherae TaxID=2763006 RepID=UPI0036D0708C